MLVSSFPFSLNTGTKLLSCDELMNCSPSLCMCEVFLALSKAGKALGLMFSLPLCVVCAKDLDDCNGAVVRVAEGFSVINSGF